MMNVNQLLSTARPLLPDDVLAKKDLQSGFWRKVFLKANEIDASDIHVECSKDFLTIRCRVQGELTLIEKYIDERDGIRSLINRLKMICRMNLSVDDETQDKSISFNLTKSRYRIALSPTIFGENFVFRIIRDEFIPKLSDLFLPESTEKHLRSSINQKQGFICITGPTGSGKSTTLQSILMELDRKKMKIITIENPVERIIPDTMQKEISDKVGWKKAIKMALREDPDIILIGEIRDTESAELALEASQTGHLVFSTLHTNDVAGIVDRLIGLGVERRLIAENLLFVSAQRLIQRLCTDCKIPTTNGRYKRGKGCSLCINKGVPGIKGRLPVVEYSYHPDANSILHFERENFSNKQLQTTLSRECIHWINQGEVDENELQYWQ
jgi:type II secretory ATPase GspE/PulE/Tfp pilus assembly ATPase PilB-like protein